jgi:type 2 lantibiotic biosynthesis protein LanM
MPPEQWFRGTTLDERVRLARSGTAGISRAPADVLRTHPRLARLRESAVWPSYLESIGSTEPELLDACQLTGIGQGASDALPAWIGSLEEASSARVEVPPWSRTFAGSTRYATTAALLDGISAHIAAAVDRLRDSDGARRLSAATSLDRAIAASTPTVLSRLLLLCERVSLVELKRAGATSNQQVIGHLSDRAFMRAVLERYPVVARLMTTTLENWWRSSAELLGRVADDWAEVATAFDLADGDWMAAIRSTGDAHHGGRTVQVIEWHSGARFVYKPRSLAVDVVFQQVLAWMNRRGFQPSLRECRVFDHGAYGWQEFIPASSCHNTTQVDAFYARLGAFAMLFHLLEGTDCHYENVIACGEHPVWVDLEGLFQGRPIAASPTSDIPGCYWDSLLRTGVLPCRVSSEAAPTSVDYSALSGPSPGAAPRPALHVVEDVSGVRLQAVEREMSRGNNIPVLDEVRVDPATRRSVFIDGFESAFRIVHDHKDDWLGPDGLLDRFAEVGVRSIVRHTKVYGELLTDLSHPSLATDALLAENHLAILWNAVRDRGLPAAIAAAERRDLWSGDIPSFATTPASVNVAAGDRSSIDGFLSAPPLTIVARRLSRMSLADLGAHDRVIRHAFELIEEPVSPAGRTDNDLEFAAWAERVARQAADWLCERAIVHDRRATWVGLTVAKDSHWSLGALGLDLYEGLPGVALFLAYAGSVLEEPRYRELARAACDQTLARLADLGASRPSIGAVSGLGGIAYSLAHAGSIWDEPFWIDQALRILREAQDSIHTDDTFDVFAGSAGLICAASSVSRLAGSSPAIVEVCRRAALHLAAHAREREDGSVSWTSARAKQSLTGFAHGAAGIGLGLWEASDLLGDPALKELAERAWRYEAGVFDRAAGNWPDFRNIAQSPHMTAWCHGAVGIGCSRLIVRSRFGTGAYDGDIRAAFAAADGLGPAANQCLCHGDLGNILFMQEAVAALPDLGSVQSRLDRFRERFDRSDWLCGAPTARRTQVAGLMMGIAGIGYGLLRLIAPERVPNVLLMADPVQSNAEVCR